MDTAWCEWTIKGDSLEEMRNAEPEDAFESPIIGPVLSTSWQLVVYPRGEYEEDNIELDTIMGHRLVSLPGDEGDIHVLFRVQCIEIGYFHSAVYDATENDQDQRHIEDMIFPNFDFLDVMKKRSSLTFKLRITVIKLVVDEELIYKFPASITNEKLTWNLNIQSYKFVPVVRESPLLNRQWIIRLGFNPFKIHLQFVPKALVENICFTARCNIEYEKYRSVDSDFDQTRSINFEQEVTTFGRWLSWDDVIPDEHHELRSYNSEQFREKVWQMTITIDIEHANGIGFSSSVQQLQSQIDEQKEEIQKLKKQIEMKQFMRQRRRFVNNPIVLIIAIGDYNQPTKNLPGTIVDKKNMKRLFKHQYGYKVICSKQQHVDWTEFHRLLDKTKTELKHPDRDYDGVFVVVSSHGTSTKGTVDSIVTSDNKLISVESIMAAFNGNSIAKLVKCPKVFIFDCCRGANVPVMVSAINNDKHDTEDEDIDIVMEMNMKGKDKKLVHPDKNIIGLYAVTKGYTTEDTEKGGYLIQAVDTVLRSNDVQRYDLLQLSQKILRKTERISDGRNCPQLTSTTFDEDFYIYPLVE